MKLNDIFNAEAFDATIDLEVALPKKEEYVSEIYRPKVKKGDSAYNATLKFLYPRDIIEDNFTLPYVTKYICWMPNSKTGKGQYIDANKDLTNIFFTLKNHNDATVQVLQKKYSSYETNFAVVQIISDENNPKLNGEIKVFQFGRKIKDIITNQMKPTNNLVTPNQPFNFQNGELFSLSISHDGQWPSYANSQFIKKTFPGFIIDGKEVMWKDKKSQDEIKDFYVENVLSLDKYKAKEWTLEIKQTIHAQLQMDLYNHTELYSQLTNDL